MLDMLRNTVPKFGQKNRPVFEFIKEEPVVIVPQITKVSAAGEMRIDFVPPQAIVPESWGALFDLDKKAEMSQAEIKYLDSVISEVFKVIFIKNSDEKE